MASYAIMRMEKRNIGSVGRIGRHNERLKTEYKSNPDIDLERTSQNYHIIEPHDSYRKMVLDRIQEAGAKRRKDSVVMQDSVVGEGAELKYVILDKDVQVAPGTRLVGSPQNPLYIAKGASV